MTNLGILHLIQHMALERGGNVCQQPEGGRAVGVRHLGHESLEHVQLHAAGGAGVEVPVVLAGPAEGFSLGGFKAGKVDLARAEELDVLFREIDPTMPTRLTCEKNAASTDAYEAEPPSRSACSSMGVLTVSRAIEPTTRTDMRR